MSAPSMRFRLPPRSLFKFPPDPSPPVLPPPSSESKFAAPFPIDPDIYNDALQPIVPITIATLYLLLVLQLNKINRNSGYKPWRISQTSVFFAFVILHNVFLAAFSALVFVAMMRALRHTWPSHREYPAFGVVWPGMRTLNGFAGAADALCKLHGPRGFGDAVIFNATHESWEVKNKLIRLTTTGHPDPTDVGRLWNEGLAFWGWWFYLSKFYEVFDTLIILMKGKRSSTLQVYHHMGAMLCMWAGMRYMSSPIWMFCWLNSGIHTLMYIYYTLSALSIRIPRRIKKTLTTMQISQFLIGFTFASFHLFVEYTIPVSAIYAPKHAFKVATAAVLDAVSTISSVAVEATASATFASDNWAKKLLLRAAGQEALAENVRSEWGEVFAPEVQHVQQLAAETRDFTTSGAVAYETISCIDTTGQSFAVWLNLFYLAPLTWLFIRFFWRSYSRRGAASADGSKAKEGNVERLSMSAEDAAKSVDRELNELVKSAEDGMQSVIKKVRKSDDHRSVSETIGKFQKGLEQGYDAASEAAKEGGKGVKKLVGKASEEFKENVGFRRDDGAGKESRAEMTLQKMKERADELLNEGMEKVGEVVDGAKIKGKEVADAAAMKGNEATDPVLKKVNEVADHASKKVNHAKDTALKRGSEAADSASKKANEAEDAGKEKTAAEKDEAHVEAQNAKCEAQIKASNAQDDTQSMEKDAKDDAQNKAKNIKDEARSKARAVKGEAQVSTRDTKVSAQNEAKDVVDSAKTEQSNISADAKEVSKETSKPNAGVEKKDSVQAMEEEELEPPKAEPGSRHGEGEPVSPQESGILVDKDEPEARVGGDAKSSKGPAEPKPDPKAGEPVKEASDPVSDGKAAGSIKRAGQPQQVDAKGVSDTKHEEQ